MTEAETKVNITGDEAPAVTDSSKDDIPAVDAEEVKGQESAENGEKANETVQAPPKNPREDPVGWVSSLIPGAVHKVNYQLLDWAQHLAIEDEEQRMRLPGKNDAVTKNQFLGFLRDGTLLAKLANRLQSGAITTIHEGEDAKDKSKQLENINEFINFAKQKAGLSDNQVFTAEDLQDKGKAGYQAVLNTLIQLGIKSQETFEQKGVDIDQITQIASQVTQTNLIQTVLNFFRRARPIQSPKQLAKEAEEKEKAEKTATAEKVMEEKQPMVEEELCKKLDAPSEAGAPAIPAN